MSHHILIFHALSPLHAGTGQGMGSVELPIAREKGTHIPILPGSSIKGVLRSVASGEDKTLAFGPETDGADEFAGAICFGDARLVLLPMRSVAGVFAWVTSPYLLRRAARDFTLIGKNLNVPAIASDSACLAGSGVKANNRVVLEDLDFTPENDSVDAIAIDLGNVLFQETSDREFLKTNLCIVSDTVMGLLLETGTELRTRIRINSETKVVADGQLWDEEFLPVESILIAPVLCEGARKRGANKSANDMAVYLKGHLKHNGVLQFGGNASVGSGLCKISLDGGAQ